MPRRWPGERLGAWTVSGARVAGDMTGSDLDEESVEIAAEVGRQPIHARFADVVLATPDALALVCGDDQLTYAELDARANGLAAHLRSRGVAPGDRVAVLMDRCTDLVVALIAILKTGAAYVALDPRDPAERLDHLVEAAGAAVVLTHKTGTGGSGDPAEVACLPPEFVEAAPSTSSVSTSDAAGEAVAYVAFTSGSTGSPKGVCVPHRAVSRLVLGSDVFALGPDDVFLQYAPVAFDASTLEIWGALLNGGVLVVAPPGELAPSELIELVRSARVTVLWLTAGLFHQVVDSGVPELRSLRYLLAGGDTLSSERVDSAVRALPYAVVVNGYGPTENTTFTCCHAVREPVGATSVPIGRPIRGTGVYVLDEELDRVPNGAAGTLFATGTGLAHGYLGSPRLTAERFLPDPYARTPGGRMYDTGDRCRSRADGVLEFLGRRDAQVKIRGFRVEPGEVEAALQAHPDISTAMVVAQDRADAPQMLVAFYESPFPLSHSDLRRQLAVVLPPYMIPSSFRWLDAWPLTTSGKVDREALRRRRSRQRPTLGTGYRAPTTVLESWLVHTWQELMELEPIGVDDDFFELGGHSLMATRITGEIAQTHGVPVKARAFYENSTIAELSTWIANLSDAAGVSANQRVD